MVVHAAKIRQLTGDKRSPVAGRTRLRFAYGVLGTVLVAYIASVIARGGRFSMPVDGWGVDALELVLGTLMLARVRVPRPGRAASSALGIAVISWAVGDVVATIEALGGRAVPMPSLADVFYLAFYPIAYVGIVLYLRADVGKITAPSWLDGAVAGLGAAAACAAFAFHSILSSTGGGVLGTATNLAYPIGDVLLLALVVGGTAVLSASSPTWVLLVGACVVNAVGDTVNLFNHTAFGMTRFASDLNAVAWPIAMFLVSVAVWLPPRTKDPLVTERPNGFVLPGVAATAGLVILVTGTFEHLSRVALSLAAATLVVAGARTALSVISLRKITTERHRQAVTDELTGLGNRRYLAQVLEGFFSRQRPSGGRLAFLFVDLDHFKEINDSFGHAAGDAVLRLLGPRLSSCLKTSDVLVRIGGDEFAVVLFDADEEYALEVAGRLARSLEEPFFVDVMRAKVAASIGIALAPDHATTSHDLLRCADVAMYRAKLGRRAFEIYDAAVDDDGNLLRLAEELRVAVAEDQFVLHFQPQLDLRSGKVTAVEALVRWSHPRLGLIPPLKFLPIAEEAGLMPSLTALVLDDALAQAGRWRRDGHELSVSVNMSASNLLDPGFTDLVQTILNRHGLPPEALVLEITETSIISEYEKSKAVVEALRKLGVVVSIDDFGAGFTSLAYLGDLAVGELKLDRVFITTLTAGDREKDQELVRSTIGLGHALGLRVVAEGVEDRATLSLLADLGCDLVQGYYISRPKPAVELDLASGELGSLAQAN